MKRIFFIAGTSYSGSTLLDLILSNDDNTKSVGEIEALFHPVRQHHLDKVRELKRDPLWSRKLREGPINLYKDLHSALGVSTIVDSSKNPTWIRFQIDRLPSDITYSVILVHKDLANLKNSFEKRGRLNWIRVYKNYHSLFFRNIKDFYRLEYKEIPKQTDIFFEVLKKLGVDMEPQRLNFWEQERTNFFGNNNTNKSFGTNKEDKRLYYESFESPEVAAFISDKLNRDTKLASIYYYLRSEDYSIKPPVYVNLMTNYWFRRGLKNSRMILAYSKNLFR